MNTAAKELDRAGLAGEPRNAEVIDLRGDDQSFREFYKAEVRRVHHRLALLTGSGDHVDDLVQQTFLEFYRSLPAFRGECRTTTWLTRIAINVALQHRRRNRRKPPHELGLAVDEMIAVPAPQDHAIELRRAVEALDRLPDKLRVSIILREVEGMTFEEMATVTGTSISTAAARVKRARKRVLRDLTRGRKP